MSHPFLSHRDYYPVHSGAVNLITSPFPLPGPLPFSREVVPPCPLRITALSSPKDSLDSSDP